MADRPSFKAFCGRCGKPFLGLDVTVMIRGQVRRHAVYCERWDPVQGTSPRLSPSQANASIGFSIAEANKNVIFDAGRFQARCDLNRRVLWLLKVGDRQARRRRAWETWSVHPDRLHLLEGCERRGPVWRYYCMVDKCSFYTDSTTPPTQ